MGYALGVDLGTTTSAAAIGRDGVVEVYGLGDQSPSIPSVVVVRDDGSILTGDAADRRAREEPASVAREFKRRFGDPMPYLLGGQSLTADELTGIVLGSIVERVRAGQAEEPAVLALAHPADYGPYKLDLLRRVASGVTTAEIVLVPEPVAAALKHASESRIEPGALLAVYDFGGGTFDAAVVRRTTDDFEVVDVPGGLPQLGGADFDAAMLAHVDASLDGALATLNSDDPTALGALHRIRAECCTAKEHLSYDSDVSVTAALPGGERTVRVTRNEFEDMIRPQVEQTVAALEATVAAAGLAMADLHAILLVGGSSRIPLVAELVSGRTGRPTLVDPYPKLTVAFGAGVVGLAALTPKTEAAPQSVTMVEPPPTGEVVLTPSRDPRRRRALAALIAGLVVLGAVAGAVLALRDGEPGRTAELATSNDTTTTSSTATSTSTTTTSTTTTTTTTTLPPTTAPPATAPPATAPPATAPPATAPPATAPPQTQPPTTSPPSLPLPRDVRVQRGGGSGELAVNWLADARPPVESYQTYLSCGSAGNTVRSHRTVPNVADESTAPAGRRGFIDFGECNFGTACYSVAARNASGTEGPRTTPVCGTP